MSISVPVNRALIAIDAFIRGHIKGKTDNKTVIIIFQQAFGDSVVIQESLMEYTKIFPPMNGWIIKFLANPSILSFMKNVIPLPDNISYEALNFKRFLEDYRYYNSEVKKFKQKAGVLIVPGTSLSAEIFSCA